MQPSKNSSHNIRKPLILILFLLVGSFFLPSQNVSAQSIQGIWSGKAFLAGYEVNMSVKFRESGNNYIGLISIPKQGVTNMKLQDISYNHPKVVFKLNGQAGMATFTGFVETEFVENEEGGEVESRKLRGEFEQMGFKGNFDFRYKGDLEEEELEDVPYEVEKVNFENDGNVFAGTLTMPDPRGPHPAVILVTGSGPQDRNEEIVGFKLFKVIADYLTQKGIAVLRYDDRGVGETTGKTVNESTTMDFAHDVLAAKEYLKTRPQIDPSKIGILGHSEGGIVAPLAASMEDEFAFIVLMAGTGVNGRDIILEQSALIMKANGAKKKKIKKEIKIAVKEFEMLKTEEGVEEIRKKIEDKVLKSYSELPPATKAAITDSIAYVDGMINAQMDQLTSKWMTFFLNYDPIFALTKVKCPVLMLFGELDLQVAPDQNLKPMEKALEEGGNKDVTVKVFPKANHLFQEAETGSPNEYANLKKEFVKGFLPTVSDWILEKSK